MPRLLPCLFVLLSVIAGCTRYEFRLLSPPESAGVIGKAGLSVAMPGVVCQFDRVEDRIVLRVFNQTSQPMRLVGEESAVVSPDGQTRPVGGAQLLPESFARLLLPPPRPRLEPDPRYTYGYGYGSGYDPDFDYLYNRGRPARPRAPGDRRAAFSDPLYRPGSPPTYELRDENNPAFWDWPGEGDVSLHLVLEQNGQPRSIDFRIEKRRVEKRQAG